MAPQLSWALSVEKRAASAFCARPVGREIVALLVNQNRKYLLIFRYLLRLRRISFYLMAPAKGAFTVTDFPRDERHILAPAGLQDWLIAIATAFAAFVLLGVLPRLFW